MAQKQKTGYRWNPDVYKDRKYTAPDGTVYDLSHLKIESHSYNYKYRDEEGARLTGKIDIEIRYDPHCFTHERKAGETDPTLAFDLFEDGSTSERVFDVERFNNTKFLTNAIKNLSNKNCKESRVVGKALYFKQQDRQKPRQGLYVIIKVKKEDGRLVMFVETAHNRNNEPYKLELSDKEETYSIILGRLIKTQWPELLAPQK